MTRGASSPASAVTNADAACDSASTDANPGRTMLRLGCVALAGLFLANCANDQVARRGRSKEIGAFPQAKYGPASPRVVVRYASGFHAGFNSSARRIRRTSACRAAFVPTPSGPQIVGSSVHVV